MSDQTTKIDPLVEPLLLSTSDEQFNETLSDLMTRHAGPVIKRVIGYKLHLSHYHGTGEADASDIHQEVIVQLLTRIRTFRQQPDVYPISDFCGLTSLITRSACARWMQRRFPERHSFKNRLHYLLTRQPGFSLWQSESGKQAAGFTLWHGRRDAAPVERLERLSDDEELMSRIRSLKSGREADWGDVLAAIFDSLNAPVDFNKLTGFLARVLHVEDQPAISIDQIDEPSLPDLAAEQPDAAWQTEKRIFLKRTWEEICQLPAKQRVALLLNLKRGYHELFLSRGITTIRQMAKALELSVENLLEMWDQMPLEDARIAELLRLTRQQVINARKSARKRLVRRLSGFI